MHTNWTVITKSNDLHQIILSLKQNRKKRNEAGELFVEGIESIKQALKSDRVKLRKIIFADYEKLSDWAKDLVQGGRFPEPIQMAPALYNELSDRDEPSELIITLSIAKPELANITLGKNAVVVIFDRPSDHGNLGSLIRTANAFGVDLVITHGHCVDIYDPKVIRSSLGSVFHTPIVHEESFSVLQEWIERQKKETGLILAGTDSTGSVPLQNAKLRPPVAIVLGNEAKGMSVNLKSITDRIVSIPMCGNVNSLNVACAGSILLWAVSSAKGA